MNKLIPGIYVQVSGILFATQLLLFTLLILNALFDAQLMKSSLIFMFQI